MKQTRTHLNSLSMMHKKMRTIRTKCHSIDTDGSILKKKLLQLSNYTKPRALLKIQPQLTEKAPRTSTNNFPIFITARFRSGSTFLWNFLSNIPGLIAFYEPLQENLPEHLERGTPAQESHIGVNSYWEEYSHISSRLKEYHRAEFGFHKLLLEENDCYDELKTYITFLLESSKREKPVLQFNRIDFRLPWIKKNYPEAKIIHLYRNPRDQWFSMIKGQLAQDVTEPDLNTNYDLFLWAVYLTEYFPFLTDSIESSYERHYYIWKLSELMGQRCAHISIDFDNEIQTSPDIAFSKIKTLVDIDGYEKLFFSNIAPVQTGQWESIKPKEWFESIEKKCDQKLNTLGLLDFFAIQPLKKIIHNFSNEWDNVYPETKSSLQKKTITLLLKTRGSIIKINKDLDNIVANSNEVADNSQKIVAEYIKKTKDHQ